MTPRDRTIAWKLNIAQLALVSIQEYVRIHDTINKDEHGVPSYIHDLSHVPMGAPGSVNRRTGRETF